LQRFRDTKRQESFENHAKKNTIEYTERDEQKRAEFIAEIAALPENTELYYIDEAGFDKYYSREYGYALRGEKVIGKISGRHFMRTSIVAAKNGDGVVAPFAFSGTMNSDLFVGWFEQIFVPELKNPKNSVAIIDNATHHPKDEIYDIADDYGFKVIFLPPYSPDLNKPIENVWANTKRRLRLHMHKFGSFWEALAHAFN